MTNIDHRIVSEIGEGNLSFLSRFVGIVFGEDSQCVHGTKGSDGVCMDCCNDLYPASEGELADVIDFRERQN